jgi:hypothetical protein
MVGKKERPTKTQINIVDLKYPKPQSPKSRVMNESKNHIPVLYVRIPIFQRMSRALTNFTPFG